MFDEDLSVFFDDFAVTFTWKGESAKGLLDQATFVIDGQVLGVNSNALTLHKPHNVFPALAASDTVTIEGTDYRVRRVERTGDGAIDAVLLNAI